MPTTLRVRIRTGQDEDVPTLGVRGVEPAEALPRRELPNLFWIVLVSLGSDDGESRRCVSYPHTTARRPAPPHQCRPPTPNKHRNERHLDDAVRVPRGDHLPVPREGHGHHRDVVHHELLVRLFSQFGLCGGGGERRGLGYPVNRPTPTNGRAANVPDRAAPCGGGRCRGPTPPRSRPATPSPGSVVVMCGDIYGVTGGQCQCVYGGGAPLHKNRSHPNQEQSMAPTHTCPSGEKRAHSGCVLAPNFTCPASFLGAVCVCVICGCMHGVV